MGTTGLGAAGLLLSGDSALGANGDIRIAVAGCGRKSGQHIQIFNSLPGVRVTALCDPDPDCLNRGLSALKSTGRVASGYQDPRRLFEKDGQKVVVDAVSLPFLENAVIDFSEELIGARFVIDNPNAASSCGCGVSFSI